MLPARPRSAADAHEHPLDQRGDRDAARALRPVEDARAVPAVAGVLGGAGVPDPPGRAALGRVPAPQGHLARSPRSTGSAGLKAGLNQYLDLYAVGPTRPRVALDDGSRVLTVVPQREARGPGDRARHRRAAREGERGRCWRGSPDRRVPRCGGPGCSSVTQACRREPHAGEEPGLAPWAVSAQYVTSGDPPQRAAARADQHEPHRVAALRVKPAQGGTPERLFVLDQSGALFAVPAPYLGTTATSVGRLNVAGATFGPVAMSRRHQR